MSVQLDEDGNEERHDREAKTDHILHSYSLHTVSLLVLHASLFILGLFNKDW